MKVTDVRAMSCGASNAHTERIDATYWHAEVLLENFRIQFDAWGIFKGKESAARLCLY